MNKIAKSNVHHCVRENTCDMETEEYVAFMRELSDWATNQADMVEFTEDFTEQENE